MGTMPGVRSDSRSPDDRGVPGGPDGPTGPGAPGRPGHRTGRGRLRKAALPTRVRIADRIWIATALLHQTHPSRADFSKNEIRQQIADETLADDVERGTINAHLNEHCVANVAPSSGKYRMLYQTELGNLRLFRSGDPTHPARSQLRAASKVIPRQQEIPERYLPLLGWYTNWVKEFVPPEPRPSWEDDPLIGLVGSGKHIWADEHADEYVDRLREEPA